MSHRDRVGENSEFLLGHGGDLLNLGELGCLIHGVEVIPLFVVAEVEQAVVDQDPLVFEGHGEQELLVVAQFEHIFSNFPALIP